MNTLHSQDAATPLDESIRLIPLSQGKFATVDAADYEWLNQWKWSAKADKRTFCPEGLAAFQRVSVA